VRPEDDRATQAARDAAAERLGSDYAAGMISTDTLEASVVAVLTARHRCELEDALRQVRPVGEVVIRPHEESVILGRSSSCERTFDDEGVSGRHALLRAGSDGWRLVDLASTNGTWLNGRRIARPTRVSDGDELRLGRLHLTLRLPG
jgi:pSer/pThr/pTyr-binding forkhead associated (FHA) protein